MKVVTWLCLVMTWLRRERRLTWLFYFLGRKVTYLDFGYKLKQSSYIFSIKEERFIMKNILFLIQCLVGENISLLCTFEISNTRIMTLRGLECHQALTWHDFVVSTSWLDPKNEKGEDVLICHKPDLTWDDLWPISANVIVIKIKTIICISIDAWN